MELGNDSSIMDGDYYAPTYRRIKDFASPDEDSRIFTTPHAMKLTNLQEDIFRESVQSTHNLIVYEGVIVLDGVGKHSGSTEALLNLADILIVLCSNTFDVSADSASSHYIKDEKAVHPFLFYKGKKDKYICIKTHYQDKKVAYFDPESLTAELYDLEITSVKKGNIDLIPIDTRRTIKEIATYILGNWI